MDAKTFQEATTRAYELLGEAIQQKPHRHLVRVWNFIPSILDPLGDFNQRYMVFNAGRFSAYERKYGGRDKFPVAVATASGVGHQDRDLVIHGLATDKPGKPVENPRQIPSYLYSKKFGHLPPCFARGTLVHLDDSQNPTLLIGGTASIRGEQTMFEEDLATQTSETLKNLDALVAAGCSRPYDPTLVKHGSFENLHRFRHLRIYFRDVPPPKNAVEDLLENFPGLESLEVAQADVCRPGLVIEIEGAADAGS